MATLSITPTSQISSDKNVVTSEVFIAAPRERIFAALTDPKQAVQWWGQNDRYHLTEFNLDPRVGGEWSTSGVGLRMGEINIHGEVLELDPPRRLSYTWISSWMPKRTTVLWELETQNGGTLVKLTHTGFAGDAEAANAHSTGWNLVLGWLQGYAERGETVSSRK
ncbi:MAG TPA: SRPBCC domain-containing protein [Terriglobales bacterium]|nr:SRPBCC domain-containing protein [Terriglobales bacterium]